MSGRDAIKISTPRNILLAEDNPDHQRLLCRALQHERPDVHVTVVATGAEFLRSLKSNKFDCVVIDYLLPDFEADNLLTVARDDLKDCPVLVVSARDTQDVVISSIRSGGVDFIAKRNAIVGDELWRRVTQATSRYRQKITERRKIERRQRELVSLADHDPLTGLYNRRFLEQCLLCSRWRNDRRRAISCMMLDIDYFKKVNDTFGHEVGDAVLKDVADSVNKALSPQDIAVRYGGEEILILRLQPHSEYAWAWADSLRRAIESHSTRARGQTVGVTVSIGVAQTSIVSFDADTIDLADKALYLAKDQGRNAVCPSDMVIVARELTDIAKHVELNPEQRGQELLRRLSHQLGAIQRQYLTEHSALVSEMAVRLGRLLNLDPAQIERLRLAGLMHDIGKCIIPERLLSRPRALTPEEWRLMARHGSYGVMIAKLLGMDEGTIGCLKYHHRRYDDFSTPGAPDPHHDTASMEARVLRVADALAAMLANRPYQPARPMGQALQELRRERGRQFAPEVVDAACRIGRPPDTAAA